MKGARIKVERHLKPYFGHPKMAGIGPQDLAACVAQRLEQGIVNRKGARVADVSHAEVNRELALLKRMFNLAIQHGRIASKPHVAMLK